MKKHFFSLVTFLIFISIGLAISQTDPLSFSKRKVEDIISIVANRKLSPSVKRAEISKIIDEIIDWDYVSKSVLGVHYRRISSDDYKFFVTRFREYIKDVYAGKFIKYRGEKVEFTKEEKSSDYAKVYAEVFTADGKKVPVVAILRPSSDKWLLTDIYIEGVSMVANYRSQVNTVISQKGFKALLEMLSKGRVGEK